MGWDMDSAIMDSPPELSGIDPRENLWDSIGDDIWDGLIAYEQILQNLEAKNNEPPELPSAPVVTPVPLYSADPIVWTDKIEEFRTAAETEAAEMTSIGIASGTLLTSRETWEINTVE